ncbi:hypothetical protein KM043_016608 [Ampulex compressa]|nr:hypothetical protein KM043_016608 [Ampulex compressa]
MAVFFGRVHQQVNSVLAGHTFASNCHGEPEHRFGMWVVPFADAGTATNVTCRKYVAVSTGTRTNISTSTGTKAGINTSSNTSTGNNTVTDTDTGVNISTIGTCDSSNIN